MSNLIRREGSRLANWDPFSLMREMLSSNDPFAQLTALPRERAFVPQFEVKETKEGYLFKGDLPGLEQKDVDITVHGNRLTISGKREEESRKEEDNYFVYERNYGTFSRAFTLPSGVDADKVIASLDKGVLTVLVPKKAENLPKKISVK